MNRVLVRTLSASLTFLLGVFATTVRLRVAETPPSNETAISVSPTESTEALSSEDNELNFIDKDKLSFRNYEVVKLHKKVSVDFGAGRSEEVEVSFAELRQNSRTIASFDGVYHTLGNETEFGLFNLLGKNESQLVVQQTISRGGRHWVYDLSGNEARPIFDGHDWGACREDLEILDLNSDREKEIAETVTDFYDLQDKFAMAYIPLPTIVFKFDERWKKYVPANSEYRDFTLKELPLISKSANADDMQEQSIIISTLLDFVFAGQREKGWAFYEQNYRGADKTHLKNRIRAILKQQPVYQFIYYGVTP